MSVISKPHLRPAESKSPRTGDQESTFCHKILPIMIDMVPDKTTVCPTPSPIAPVCPLGDLWLVLLSLTVPMPDPWEINVDFNFQGLGWGL